MRAYQERPSMPGIQRIFGVSRPTLIEWLKKNRILKANGRFEQAFVATLLPAQDDDVLGLDEL